MRKTIGIAAATALILSAPFIARATSSQDYLVRVQMRSDTALIAEPSLQVHASEPATLETSTYTIRVSAAPDGAHPGNILLTSDITLRSQASNAALTRREHTTTVSLRPDQKVKFDIAPSPGSTDEQVHVELSAAAVR